MNYSIFTVLKKKCTFHFVDQKSLENTVSLEITGKLLKRISVSVGSY